MTTFGGCIYATQTMVIIQFHFIIDTRYFLVAMLPYDSCVINTAQCFIHALYDLRLKEINFIIKNIIPLLYHFHSSIPNPCDIVSERAITQIVSKVLVLSCYSDSLTLAQVARPMRDTTAWVILDLTIFSGADSQFLLFTKRTHTIFIFYRTNSFAKSCTSK